MAVFITDGSEGERVGAKLSADVDKRPVRREGDAGGGGEGVRRWQPIPCESERRASGVRVEIIRGTIEAPFDVKRIEMRG